MKNFLALILATLLCAMPASATYLGNPVKIQGGGTGLATLPSAGQILVGNGGGTAYALALMNGEASMSSAGAVTLSNSAVIGKVLTGYTSGAGTITAADTILSAIQKLNGNTAAAGITALTGDVTASGSGSVAATIAANAVTNAKAAQMAAHTFKGNNTASTANALDLTASQVKTDLAIACADITNAAASCTIDTSNASNISSGTLSAARLPAFSGDATSSAGSSVLTLASVISAGSCTNCNLSYDAKGRVTVAANGSAGSGTVTSVAATVPSFLSIAGSPVTTSGTLAFSLSGTALPTTSGGTGQTSYTDGQLLIGNSSGNGLTKSTLTAGSGITITNGNGSISIAASGGGGGLDTARFTLEGALVPYVSINGPKYQTGTQTLSTVNISALNSGTSGSTTIQVNQYRAGALIASPTASLSSSSGAPNAGAASLSASLSLIAGDIITVDVNSVAPGASDLSVEWGTVAAATGGTSLTVLTKTANYTLTNTDDVILVNSASAITITLHSVATATAKSYRIKNVGTGAVTIARAGADTIDGDTSIVLYSQYESVNLIPNGGTAWSIF